MLKNECELAVDCGGAELQGHFLLINKTCIDESFTSITCIYNITELCT